MASTSKQTRDQRRETARLQAEKLRAEQAAKERRSRIILLSILGGFGVLVVGVLAFIWSSSQTTLLDNFDGAVPAGADSRGGIPVNAAGVAGVANAGSPELAVYLDYMCPYCGQFEAVNAADLTELRESGELTVTYYMLANLDSRSLGTQFSTRAANASATVANDAPEYFIPFVEGIFANQPDQNTEGLSDAEMAEIAVSVGVPQEVADSFADGTYAEWVAAATQQAARDGVTGTPTIELDGERPANDVNYMADGVLRAWLVENGVSGGTVTE